MKITLNELKNFVRNVIKEEEEERSPKEEMRNEFKVLIGNYNNAIEIQTEFKRFLNNTDTSKVSKLVENYFEKYSTLSNAVYKMFNVELPKSASPLDTLSILKISLPKILEATLKVFSILKKIYEISDNDELDNFIKNFQLGLLPFKMTIDRMIKLIPIVEPLYSQQQNNVPQQQSNTPQQQTNTPQQQGNSPQSGVTENLKNFNNELKNLFLDFEKEYILSKKQYIEDEISEKQFSTKISNYFPPMSRLVSQMENEIPINENSFKISIFEDSDFDNYFASLKNYVNTIDEAVLKGKTTNIAESINGIKQILNVFQQDLNIFSR